MKAELLNRAVTEDMTGVLLPVMKAAYSLIPVDKFEVVEIAHKTNQALGYELFDDLYYPRLILDFARVSRAVQHNALKSS